MLVTPPQGWLQWARAFTSYASLMLLCIYALFYDEDTRGWLYALPIVLLIMLTTIMVLGIWAAIQTKRESDS